ncbi:Uncharacterized protein MLTONO_2903 [Mesorhizobium loti]|nr:Uncharacterized protein MLTONO_2903 [Mesorhizobium loti]
MVVAALARGLLPCRPEFGGAGEDSEVRTFSFSPSAGENVTVLTLRLRVLTEPEEPFAVRENVPIVAIVVFLLFSRAAPIAASMVVVRPETIVLHPEGAETK